MKDIELWKGDCLELMKYIPDSYVDFVLCDPPYGTIKGLNLNSWSKEDTQWDNVLPTDLLFKELLRVCRHNGKIVLFCQEPYTNELISHSNSYMQFGSKGIWIKDSYANYLGVNKAMVNFYEEFLVFRVNKMKPSDANALFPKIIEKVKEIGFDKFASYMFTEGRYNSINSAKRNLYNRTSVTESSAKTSFFDEKMYRHLESQTQMPYTWDEYSQKVKEFKAQTQSTFNLWEGGKYKSSILQYPKDKVKYHPTQKPVALLQDLIKTYSNEGDTILDFTMGSGSTGVAALHNNRKFVGIEMNDKYFNIAKNRINSSISSYEEVES